MYSSVQNQEFQTMDHANPIYQVTRARIATTTKTMYFPLKGSGYLFILVLIPFQVHDPKMNV
jgi:hypothetical protein